MLASGGTGNERKDPPRSALAHFLRDPLKMAIALTRGRTPITRTHVQVGHVVHEAADKAEFVNLTVLRGNSIGEANDFVNVENQEDIELRITVGEHPDALYFKIPRNNMQATRLVDNLHVLPYEQVVVSASCPTARCIIHGYSTTKPSNR